MFVLRHLTIDTAGVDHDHVTPAESEFFAAISHNVPPEQYTAENEEIIGLCIAKARAASDRMMERELRNMLLKIYWGNKTKNKPRTLIQNQYSYYCLLAFQDYPQFQKYVGGDALMKQAGRSGASVSGIQYVC